MALPRTLLEAKIVADALLRALRDGDQLAMVPRFFDGRFPPPDRNAVVTFIPEEPKK